MMPNRIAVVAALSLTAAALGAVGAQAAVLLTYTGNPFTRVVGLYTTSDRVTGTVVLAAPLGANLNEVIETPLSFDFTDGVLTQTNLNSNETQFVFSTDGTGTISSWAVNVGNALGPSASTNISTDDIPPYGADALEDSGRVGAGIGITSFGGNLGSPGNWAVSAVPTPVPEPASWEPTLLGLAGLAVASRARRRGPSATR